MDEREREQLIRRIADRVLERLGSVAAPPARARRGVLLLLPVAPLRLVELAGEVARVRAVGHEVRTLAWPVVLRELDRAGLRERFGSGLLDAGQAGAVDVPAARRPGELVVFGALGFAGARRLVELQDDDPLVRVATQALLGGGTVLAAVDELLPRAPGVAGELVRRGETLRRGLEQLGITLVTGAEWEERLERAAATATTVVRAVGGLLSEDDVGRLWAAGERRLVLPPRTIVTPLARSRAAALGLELVEKGS